MTDPRTTAYLRELAKAQEQNRKVTNAAEEICTCEYCIQSRMRKEQSQCDKNRLLAYLPMRIIEQMPSNFHPELSPDWNPKTGMLESNSRPVGMISNDSTNPSYVAKKWIIQD